MDNQKESLGTISVGVGSHEQREVEILNIMQASFKDKRVVSIMQIEENDTYVLSVENYLSSGRAPQSTIWLTEESFIGLLITSMAYLAKKGVDLDKIIKEAAQGDEITYSCSLNLMNKE